MVNSSRQSSCSQPCLACAPKNRDLSVVRIEGDDALARRLFAQGLWPGTRVRLVTKALGGDPLLFHLQGFRLALRREEALRVVAQWAPDDAERPGGAAG
ncbi:MAG: FeoA domain-containing protein [Planctomycetota bacterium]|nr:FeoA domain-containing protein [Planctomycetota bacterium]